MAVDWLVGNWKRLFDVAIIVVLGIVGLRLALAVGVLTFHKLRTRYFWEPKVGDRVVTLGMKQAEQIITDVFDRDHFRCTTSPYPGYTGTHSAGPWERRCVVFLKRGKWK